MKLKKPKFWDYKKPIIFIFYGHYRFFTVIYNVSKIINLKKNIKKLKLYVLGTIYWRNWQNFIKSKIYDILQRNRIKTCFIKYYSDQTDEQKF